LKTHKSLLGKLMANEDITIRVASVHTASFNPVTRTMLIPPWADISNDTSDLLLGHEVGHALYTPAEGWHDAVHNHAFPKSYANIVEDIRIEKLIQGKYPGLRSNFINGYKELLERDFFGIKNSDVNTMSFMNRLNVKSKCRNLVDVKFTQEELIYVNKAYSCETFDDVINVCNELYVWLKEKNEKAQAMNVPEVTSDETCENPAEEGDTEKAEDEVTEGGNNPDSAEEGDAEEESEEEADTKEDDVESESDVSAESEDTSSPQTEDDPDAEKADEESEGSESGEFIDSQEDEIEVDYTDASTDDNFRDKEEELIDTNEAGDIAKVFHMPSADKINKIIIPWKAAAELRKETSARLALLKPFDQGSKFFCPELQEAAAAADKSATESANALVKEFERKKSAWESQRATESKRGSLNMVKLHQYKFSEDIFLSGSNKPNAKSHGIVSLIDFSGSMARDICTTITQSYILALFCKKANIPFKFYSFTSGHILGYSVSTSTYDNDDALSMNKLLVVEQFSDDMSLANIKKAFNVLFKTWYQTVFQYSPFAAPCDSLGGTPLDSCIAIMIPVIDAFKKSNRLQKVTFVTITDGENAGDVLSGRRQQKKTLYYKNKIIFSTEGGHYKVSPTAKLLKYIQSMDVKTVGYYITAQPPTMIELKPIRSTNNLDQSYEERMAKMKSDLATYQAARKLFRTNMLMQWPKAGYDSYFFIKSHTDITADNEEFFEDIDSTSSTGDLNKALRNMGKSKIFSRVFAKSFTSVFA
jgi:hypothetical protein